VANVIVWPKVFEANRRVVLASRLLAVKGELQREGLVIHVIAREFFDLTPWLTAVADGHNVGEAVIAGADEGKTGPHGSTRDRNRVAETAARRAYTALPKGRNFH
jgi:error-prone DNA polymerase